MEKRDVIRLNPECRPVQTWLLVIQNMDGGFDLYFLYDFRGDPPESLKSTISYRALPPPNYLIEFAKTFKGKHPNALMARGSIQTHYCAWPMPDIKQLKKVRLNFST